MHIISGEKMLCRYVKTLHYLSTPSALEVLPNRALQIDMYLLTWLVA